MKLLTNMQCGTCCSLERLLQLALMFGAPVAMCGCGEGGPGDDLGIAQLPLGTSLPPAENAALAATVEAHSPIWGGGSYPDDLIDGRVAYPEWYHGIAFGGGPKQWLGEPCGERFVTLKFPQAVSISQVRVWHHGSLADHLPTEHRLELESSNGWTVASGPATTRFDLDSGQNGQYGAIPIVYDFPPIAVVRLRSVLNNCPMQGDGHGWLYEVEARKASSLTVEGSLADIDGAALSYLSADEHSYFGGTTRVHGKITLKGTPGSIVQSVVLRVLEGGAERLSTNLAASASPQLLLAFPASGELSIATQSLLFELPSSELGTLDSDTNGSLLLRVVAKTDQGDEAEADLAVVPKLVRYDSSNRFGGRDANQGGDDWVKPSVRAVLRGFAGVHWGDMSNMNGGRFAPHSSHQSGNDADGWCPAYAALAFPGSAGARDRIAAESLIAYINSPGAGRRIQNLFVSDAPGHPGFWRAVRNTTLADGRPAQAVITRLTNHRTHFHVRVAD